MLDKMSRNDGGDVVLVPAEAGGKKAIVDGLEEDMRESWSPSSRRTDDGRGDASLRYGLGVGEVGDCARNRDFGILSSRKLSGGRTTGKEKRRQGGSACGTPNGLCFDYRKASCGPLRHSMRVNTTVGVTL